ncbi:MAG: VWA domain-containing protein [Myxococcaceae bacterium]|nr:VWA domain-containing protein [Myxococcaceae bacterium]
MNHASNGGRMVTADGRTLPLKGASVVADAKAGVVRVTLEQRFVNPHAEPLNVTYTMPLPADAAVSGFSFKIGERRVIGEVDTKKKARDRFDEAVLQGRTAALLDQERSALFTQSVGNIPPHTEVVSELVLDQKLAFLADGCWEWRFPTVVAPRYLGAEGRVPDSARVTVDVADAPLPVKLSLQLSVRDRLPEGARPESPSHALHTVRGVQRFDVGFGSEDGASLDRDVVVRWRAGELQPGVELDLGRPIDGGAAGSAYGVLTLVPPARAARMASVPRDLIILLDTSGSMGGSPLAQMKRVASALIDSLDEHDFIEMIEFSNSPRKWRWRPAKATANVRQDALTWVSRLQASGGTEMRTGIIEALAPLRRDAQRQVVLMTDGQIGFEAEIVKEICDRLPEGSRVHTVGIGSGVNRSLTMPSARAGRGVEVIIGLDEDAERAAARVLARTAQPLVTKLEISGSAVEGVAPQRPADLYAGAPALCSVKLKAHGGEILVRGQTAEGEFFERLEVKPIERGEGTKAAAKLFAREAVEDLEVDLAAGASQREIDARITSLGLDFQISTRLTSWVAVSPEATVDPRAPKHNANVPQELPYGMSAEGLGLRAPAQAAMPAPAPTGAGGMRSRMVTMGRAKGAPMPPPPAKAPAPMDRDEAFDDLADEGSISGAYEMEAEEPAREDVLEKKMKEEAPVRREVAKRSVPRRPAEPASQRTQAGAYSPRRFKARIVLQKDGKLAVQFVTDGTGLEWRPKLVMLELKNGQSITVALDTALTTRDGSIPPELSVTLAVDVPALADAPARLKVYCDGELLELELNG